MFIYLSQNCNTPYCENTMQASSDNVVSKFFKQEPQANTGAKYWGSYENI